MLTPNGRGLGRLPPKPDRLGRNFLYATSHEAAETVTLPASVDLRHLLPPVYDQGQTSSCGGCAGAGMMNFLFQGTVFSPLQIYWITRVLEGDPQVDGGVITSDVLKAIQQNGAITESMWPLIPDNVLKTPPTPHPGFRIGSYAQLLGVHDYMACLAMGFPFMLGFEVPESLDGEQVDKTSILTRPDLSKEQIIGGHDTLVVGYMTNFRNSAIMRASTIDPALVDDTMLLIRNSWGKDWSKQEEGHFWMPLSYAISPTTGGDAWTARKTVSLVTAVAPPTTVTPPVPRPQATQAQKDACFASLRHDLDTQTSYGGWVSDDKLRPFADRAAIKTVAAG